MQFTTKPSDLKSFFVSKSNWTRKARPPFSTTNYILIDIYIIIIRLTARSATL